MMRKGMRAVYLFLLVTVLALTASAAGQTGSLWIQLAVGDLPVINGAFTLYRVGTPISDGYRIEAEFGGGFVREEDALSPHLTQWLYTQNQTEGTRALLDVDGNAFFSDLEEGLYLLSQTERTDGFYPFQPMLVKIPGGEKKDVNLYLEPLPMVAESPPTGQDPTPYIGAVGLVLSFAGLMLCTGGKRRW